MNLTKAISRSVMIVVISMMAFSVDGQRKMEELDRGVVAVRSGVNNYIGWRILGSELRNVSYNLYRNGVLVNNSPITGASNYTDAGASESSSYQISAIVDGVEQALSKAANVWNNPYLEIPMQPINGRFDTYNLNDASLGDLDGDGEYEVIVKRLANDKEPGATDYNLLEAYKLDGTFMWRINLGPNINNAVEVNFLVYDFDGDGKAELITRTSDGMIDGVGTNIGDRDNDGIINYRYSFVLNSDYYRTQGPDYISVFDGETGRELAWDKYIERDPIVQWGTPGMSLGQLGHRAVKCMWTVAYLDGKHPSFVNSRGIYHRIKMEAWDWDGTNLSKRWAWDSNPNGTPTSWTGQGNHNLSCGDVDNDGCDEIVYGSMVIDNDGTGLYTTGLGHGDAIHVSDMDPDREGIEIWSCLEGSSTWGALLRDGATGEELIRYHSNRDCGRCAAGDISAESPGFEVWAATESPMYSVNGDIYATNNVPMNFMIYWDGDLLREFLDHSFSSSTGIGVPVISKYSAATKSAYSIFRADGCTSNNWTKGTPSLQADMFGDWREEIIVRTTDNATLRIYTTTDETSFRMPTLMHESQYRIAVAWQMNSYNQPPHPGIYLGAETEDAEPYTLINGKIGWVNGPNWGAGASNWVDDNGNPAAFSSNSHVLFDFTGDNASAVNLVADVAPKSVTFNSFTDYSFEGTGKLSGSMELLKAGTGSLILNNSNDYTGLTKIYKGSLVVNQALPSSKVEVCMFGELFLNGTLGNGLLVKSRGKLHIGSQKDLVGTGTIQNGLTFNKGAKSYFDLSGTPTGNNDAINVSGNLKINGNCSFNFNRTDGTLAPGVYNLITFDGSLLGSIDDIEIVGLNDVACELVVANGKIALDVLNVRAATSITWSGTINSIWDFAGEKNWDNNGTGDWFLGNDEVLFNNQGSAQTIVDITEIVPIGSMLVDASIDYSFNGLGSISGSGGITKNGTGKLFVNTVNDFTGPVALNGGLVQVEYISNGAQSGPLGASSGEASNFTIDGSVLSITGTTTSTNRSFTLGSKDATIYLGGNNSMIVSGSLSGPGQLIKDGTGTLTFNEGNSHAATQINAGRLVLNTENANISGLGASVTIKDGALQMFNNTGSYSDIYWDIDIPNGFNASIGLDGRCTMYGSLTGGGTLNLDIPFIRSELKGNWSAFTGTINANTSNDGWLLLGNSAGYGNANLNLGNNVLAMYPNSNNVMIEIGELTGTTTSKLGAGGESNNTITWKIGGKGTSFQFDGMINNDQFKNSGAKAAIIKTGSGRWTLTNANTYSGGTVIERGTIVAANGYGSATGLGAVEVSSNASLAGTGIIQGAVTVNNRGYIMPGLSTNIGNLTINNTVTFMDGARYYIKADANSLSCDKITATGTVSVAGTLFMNLTAGSFAAGQSYKIFNASTILGEFSAISPSSPGDGLYWDLSLLRTNGIVKVSDTPTAIDNNKVHSFKIYPNPSKGMVTLHLPNNEGKMLVCIDNVVGGTVFNAEIFSEDENVLNLTDLKKGIYIVTVTINNQRYRSKLVLE